MESVTSPKKLQSPTQSSPTVPKNSITCTNVPESLFDATAAKKHFSKFGKVQRIRLVPKKLMCIVEYEQPISMQKAVLNAGAYDGFMFDVTRTKSRIRRHSKKDDDPDWVPDSDVEEELLALSSTPIYRVTRQKPMDMDPQDKITNKPRKVTKVMKPSTITSVVKQATPLRKVVKKVPREKITKTQIASGIESPVSVSTTQTTLTNIEAATELNQLRFKVSLTPDEQWRTLDARDRILRQWGGAGARVKVGGATIGTCPDMCPEKERLHRQAEHQVMTLETVVDSDWQLEPWRAVKQYSRSSADQEIPMCYELRPVSVLARTCAYLLHEIADTPRPVTLPDWFHFMWDRLRSIRKDITQQALCCAESIRLLEMCVRFHSHCAARLADLEHTQFDQKLNTDNLTKCLQTLKHMYADVNVENKPNEAEFRGYIALLNLGDANFWWEIKQLPEKIQKSTDISFAIQIFNALDNNNYVRFFRLVREKATYLQACILLRYFNDVRARALARIVKAYAPRGGSKYPAEDLMNALAFESVEYMKLFINHYGLRCGKIDETDISVILDRHQFIEDSDPYPLARAVNLIESKRHCTVGEVISGGKLPQFDYDYRNLYSSFSKDGILNTSALIAEDQGYNTTNDSNKDIQALKVELYNIIQGGTSEIDGKVTVNNKGSIFAKPETNFPKSDFQKSLMPQKQLNTFANTNNEYSKPSNVFSFQPAIPIVPKGLTNEAANKIFEDNKNIFTFSKPNEPVGSNMVFDNNIRNLFNSSQPSNIFNIPQNNNKHQINKNKESYQVNPNLFKLTNADNRTEVFKKMEPTKSVFGQNENIDKNVFSNMSNKNLFTKPENLGTAKQNAFDVKNIFSKPAESIFSKNENTAISGSIFAKSTGIQNAIKDDAKFPTNVFSINSHVKTTTLFAAQDQTASKNLSPSSLFKSACSQPLGRDSKSYSIFQSKNIPSVTENIFQSVNTQQSDVYKYNEENQNLQELQRIKEENLKKEEKRKEEQKRELERQEEEKRKKEELRKQEELKKQEEKRKREELRKQEVLRIKLEEQKKADLKRKAEKEKKKFQEKVEKESSELVEELVNEVPNEIIMCIVKEELEVLEKLISESEDITEKILLELCVGICDSEIKAEKFRRHKLLTKYVIIWKNQFIRNRKRRCLLDDTPVWLTTASFFEQAREVKKPLENAVSNLQAFHRGYKFTGELKEIPYPNSYNITEIIRSSLLKRMRKINYPNGKCIFWKVALVTPGSEKWLYRKIDITKWLVNAFSDKNKHPCDSLIHVGLQSWNNLIDFAISVSLINNEKKRDYSEAMEGTNGVMFYFTENDNNFSESIEETLQHKHLYHIIPVVLFIPQLDDLSIKRLETVLSNLKHKNIISDFKIFVLHPQNIAESMNTLSKNALKWLAKKCPESPPLEIDYLKSMCQRYLGNEIWQKLKIETDSRIITILKDLPKLVNCFNATVDKLTEVITNENIVNYPSFPLEFKKFLGQNSPYPKPYEFITSHVKSSENVVAIKNIMQQMKLSIPTTDFQPKNIIDMQDQMRNYCRHIGWFDKPEKVVCKAVAVMPNQFSDITMSYEDFNESYKEYNLIDFLSIVVDEKINRLNNFDNRYTVYNKSALEEYRNFDWLYYTEIISKMKHKACEDLSDIDMFLEKKRRKIALDSMEYLVLQDNDCTMVEQNINLTNDSISKYTNCKETVNRLEDQIEQEMNKSMELEKLLKAALSDV